MIILKGKYNQANVFVNELEEITEKQIRRFLSHPAFQKTYIAIMPDCHAGVGSCIGFTMKMNEYIIPNIVGVDIGCGIDSYCLGKIDIDYQALHDFIKGNIPSGFNARKRIHGKWNRAIHCEFIDKVQDACERTGQDEGRVFKSLGSLGGGNHFIEIDEDPQGRKWLTIHSGSRGFGNMVAKYHQNIAKEFMKKTFQGDAYKQLEFLPLESGGLDYLQDMEIAQEYANRNRQLIAELLLVNFFGIRESVETVKSIHNYIDLDKKIVRKGAISAQEDERCIIPFNMRDGIAICKGKGNSKYNFSAPHGAGRLMSRTRAKAEIKLEDFEKTMKDSGVWSATVNKRTLDEAPMAYKNMDTILNLIAETVDVEFLMKPVFNFKDDTSGRKRRR